MQELNQEEAKSQLKIDDEMISGNKCEIHDGFLPTNEEELQEEVEHCCMILRRRWEPKRIWKEKVFKERKYLVEWEGSKIKTWEHMSHFDTQCSKDMFDKFMSSRKRK